MSTQKDQAKRRSAFFPSLPVAGATTRLTPRDSGTLTCSKQHISTCRCCLCNYKWPRPRPRCGTSCGCWSETDRPANGCTSQRSGPAGSACSVVQHNDGGGRRGIPLSGKETWETKKHLTAACGAFWHTRGSAEGFQMGLSWHGERKARGNPKV